MKKAFVAVMLSLVLCLSVGLLAACNTTDTSTSAADEKADAIGFAAASSVGVLNMSGSASASAASTAAESSESSGSMLAKIEEYITAFENFIDRSSVTSTITASDKDGYAYRVTVTTENMHGDVSTVEVYYNVNLDLADGETFSLDYDGDFSISGVIVCGEETYDFTGNFAEATTVADGVYNYSLTVTEPITGSTLTMSEVKSLQNGEIKVVYDYSVAFDGVLSSLGSFDFTLDYGAAATEGMIGDALTITVDSSLTSSSSVVIYCEKSASETDAYITANVSYGSYITFDIKVTSTLVDGEYEYSFTVSGDVDSQSISDMLASLFGGDSSEE